MKRKGGGLVELLKDAVVRFAAGVVLLALLLFLPAGTLHYPLGWLFMGLLFIPMLLLGAAMFFLSPDMFEKRMRMDEKEPQQRLVIALSGVLFLAVFMLAGLDFRFGWSHAPRGVVIAAAVVQLASYALYAEVMRENAYLSRTVEIQEGQKVVDTGMYGVVRHPMYMTTILMFLAMPLVLGSYVAFAVMLLYPLVLVPRILNEEKVLCEGLPGYEAYMKKVRYRLMPLIW